MGVFHFLDVGQGDCSIIEHVSGRVTVIDVCNARALKPANPFAPALAVANALAAPAPSPFLSAILGGQPLNALAGSDYTNPIAYMKARSIPGVFRHVQSHADMDHMDGIKDLHQKFPVANFWDTDNICVKEGDFGRYRPEDWKFYLSIRDGRIVNGPKRLALYAGATGAFYNALSQAGEMHDGLHVLSPTPELVRAANLCNDFNDCSYVILWWSTAGRVLFCGDSHDATWEHILQNYRPLVTGVEVMIAPHHGRHSDRKWDFLDAVRPKLTLFGTAPSEHLAYGAWNSRGLPFITTTQAGNIVIDATMAPMYVYVSNAGFAQKKNPRATFSAEHGGWRMWQIA